MDEHEEIELLTNALMDMLFPHERVPTNTPEESARRRALAVLGIEDES